MPCLKWEIKYKKVVLVLESMAKHFSRFLRNYVPASLIWSIPLRPSKPFFISSVSSLSKKKKKGSKPNPMQVPRSRHSNFQAALCGFWEDHAEMISFVSHH